MRRLPALTALTAAGVLLTACTNAADTGGDTTAEPTGDGATATAEGFDPASVDPVEDIAAMLPEDFDGTLTLGVNLAYAPAEFFGGEDGQTPAGYDVDLARSLAAVLDAELEVSHAEFASIIPGIGTQYDLGISSFTITPERLETVTMISYFEAGSTFSVQAGNPAGVDPENLCGVTLGVQTGTIQEEDAASLVTECESAGAEPLEVLSYDSQADVTTNLVGGRLDVMYADSPVGQYAAIQTDGQVEQLGEVLDTAPQGIVVAQDDTELAEALQAAMQHLIDEGVWEDILDAWGVSGAVETAEINPTV